MMMMMILKVDFIDNQRQKKKTRKTYTKGDKETNCRQKWIENKFEHSTSLWHDIDQKLDIQKTRTSS